jgi:hypothetical protein
MEFLDRLKYKYQTKNYFEPHIQTQVDESDLAKILQGQVINPRKIEKPNSTTDFSYFIICNNELNNSDETKKLKFDGDMIDDLFNVSEWFGLFKLEFGSGIVVPNEYQFKFSPKHKSIFKYRLQRSAWAGGGFYQADKNTGTKILTSNISKDNLIFMFESLYNIEKDSEYNS